MDRQGGGWSVAVSRLQTCSSLSPSPPLLLIKLDGSTPKQLIPSRPLPGTGLPRSLNSLNAEQKIPPRPRSGSPEVNSSRRRPSLSQSLSRHVGAISSSPDPRGGRTRGADWPGIAGRTSSRLLIGRVPWRGLPFPPPPQGPGGEYLTGQTRRGVSRARGPWGWGGSLRRSSAGELPAAFSRFFPVMAPATARLASSKAASAAQVRARPAPRAPRPAPRAPPRAPGLAAAAALLFPPRRDRGGGGVRARARGLPPPGPLGSSTPLPAPGWGGRAGGGSPSALRPRGCPRGHAPRGSGLSDGVAAWAPGEGGMARGLRSAPPRPAVGEGPSD